MNLHLMQCVPEPTALATWAARRGLLSPDGDYGYALHALLLAAFGNNAPKPFRYLDNRQGLLAYSRSSAAVLHEASALATPDVARALGLDRLDARPFPSAWREKQQLGFEARIRPVIRANDGRERDAYLHAIDSLTPNASTGDPSCIQAHLERETVYRDWLCHQVEGGGAARILRAGMDAFRLTRVIRRARPDAGGKRPARAPSGPDVLFRGQLEIIDSAAFGTLVARGIGRHRAFGFGMLLLRPASRC